MTMVSIINLFMAAHKTNVPRWPDRRCTRSSMALSNVFLAPLPGGFHPRIDCARTADHGFDARRLWKYLWNGNSLLCIQKEERYTYVSFNHCSLSSAASGLSSFADKLSGVMHGMVSAPVLVLPIRLKGYIYHAQAHTNTSMRLRNMRASLLSHPYIDASSTPSHQFISLTFRYDT